MKAPLQLNVLGCVVLASALVCPGHNALAAPSVAKGLPAKGSPTAAKKNPDDDASLDVLGELDTGSAAADLNNMRFSHFSVLEGWEQVEPLRAQLKKNGETYHWKMERGYASPLNAQPISTLVAVPKEGDYRIYLRHSLGQQVSAPLKLTVEPLETRTGASGTGKSTSNAQSLVFGETRLLPSTLGKEQEQKLPVRFESEVQRNTFPGDKMFVWEYKDIKLAAGPHRISLQSERTDNRVTALFLSLSKGFRPSMSEVKAENTLEGVFLRYKLLRGATGTHYTVNTPLNYHWRGRKPLNSTDALWYDHTDVLTKVPAGEWSDFLDVREQLVLGGGPFSSWMPTFTGVSEGEVEVQIAWQPHEAAVVHSFKTAISKGRALFRAPHGLYGFRSPVAEPAWGVWAHTLGQKFAPEEAVVEKYLQFSEQARQTLGLPQDHPTPKLLQILTGSRTGAVHQPRVIEMLARMGLNWLPDATPDLRQKLNLYDDSSSKKLKMGDEISTYTPASLLNADPYMRAGFHQFLRKQAAEEGLSMREFLGVEDPSEISAMDALPENPGRYERRQFYCSQRYGHLATVPKYARQVRELLLQHPNARIYNNYSPHPVFLTGRDMNHSDWFIMARNGGQTLGWGEDWATGGAWSLGTPMAECVTFYAALVECSVRTRGYPAGFYVGTNCGYSAQKMFSCLSQGVNLLYLYDWGSIDGLAEGSNAWSEMEDQYLSVMQATHALGPVDEIVAKGKREPRRTALLYNRSHEIMSGSKVWLNRDWMWTFLGLRNSGIPVELVLEEDLTKDNLKQYDVLYLGGQNLQRTKLGILREWVEAGGLLIASAGTALYDLYGDPMPEAESLFGAKQHLASAKDTNSRTRVRFKQCAQFPEVELNASTAGEQKYILTPSTAQPVATYDGGDTAAVVHALGKGCSILLGVTTGEMFRAHGGAGGSAHAWLASPPLWRLGRARAEFDCPQAEVTVYDHESGTAVLVSHHAPKADALPTTPGKLSVKPAKEVREVLSALNGPLKWEMRSGRVEIQLPPPTKSPVDAILLR